MNESLVSVERVLNSRCSSDFAGASRRRHWGTFKGNEPSEEAIKRVIRYCGVPQFSGCKLEVWQQDRLLFLGFEKQGDPLKERLLHIESGMQHEAVYLACTALGLGTCIHNQGINGTEFGHRLATASHLILDISDPYETGLLSSRVPGSEKPFTVGKMLSAPLRDGDVECLPKLERLTLSEESGSAATEKDVSQLLWAAKGVTPHYVGGHPWGLTIPTWAHGLDYTDVYLLKDGDLFRYVNWTRHFRLNKFLRRGLSYLKWGLYRDSQVKVAGNPTHDLVFLGRVNAAAQLEGAEVGIVLCQNERPCRALWEVGYMLENMFLQAASLGVTYRSKVFKASEALQLAKAGIHGAVAAFLL